MTSTLEYSYRPKARTLLGCFIVIGLVLPYIVYFLATEEQYLSGFFLAKLLIISAVSVAFLVLLPLVYFRSKRSVVRLTDSELSVDNIFGRKAIRLQEIRDVRVEGKEKYRFIMVQADKAQLTILQLLLQSPAAFEELYQALRSRVGTGDRPG